MGVQIIAGRQIEVETARDPGEALFQSEVQTQVLHGGAVDANGGDGQLSVEAGGLQGAGAFQFKRCEAFGRGKCRCSKSMRFRPIRSLSISSSYDRS